LTESEFTRSIVVVEEDGKDVDPNVWTPAHAAVIKAAAKDPAGLAHLRQPAIKKALCRGAGRDRAWLSKVRPWYGRDYHFHVRIACPTDSPNCTSEPPIVTGDGCSGKELDRWFTDAVLHYAQGEASAENGRPSRRLPSGAVGTIAARKSALDHPEHRS
jgi:penicillin-insensitive murein DD-endopeptidase